MYLKREGAIAGGRSGHRVTQGSNRIPAILAPPSAAALNTREIRVRRQGGCGHSGGWTQEG